MVMVRRACGATAAVGARYGVVVVVVVARASTWLSTDRRLGEEGRGGCGICGVHARVCSMRSSARSAACFQLVFVKI